MPNATVERGELFTLRLQQLCEEAGIPEPDALLRNPPAMGPGWLSFLWHEPEFHLAVPPFANIAGLTADVLRAAWERKHGGVS